MALHRLLGLKPWESSPLPVGVTRLGVDQGDTPENCGPEWDATMPKAIRLQRELLAIAGWPDCRAEYERQLREAKERAADCRDAVVQVSNGGAHGAGTDLESRREALEDAEAEVKYREKLLDGLAEMQAKWAVATAKT
jgi:hypothetical protein